MFLAVSSAAVVELVPADVRSSTVAVFAFVTINIGGTLQLLLGPVVEAFIGTGASRAHALRREAADKGAQKFSRVLEYIKVLGSLYDVNI